MLQLVQAFTKFHDRKYGTRYPENTQVKSTITSGRLLSTIQEVLNHKLATPAKERDNGSTIPRH